MMKFSPKFRFWMMVLELEKLVLVFVRAQRTRNRNLYTACLEALTPCFFALDKISYARWIPIHTTDMKLLSGETKEAFAKGWVVSKTMKRFSSMPIDQAHEQNNELVKGSGGAVGLTQNPEAFRRWMVAGPEQARILQQFEENLFPEGETSDHQQHEQGAASQERFKKQVQNMFEVMQDMGNPFTDECSKLLVLDTRNCNTDAVVTTVMTIEDVGREQYQKYFKEVIVD